MRKKICHRKEEMKKKKYMNKPLANKLNEKVLQKHVRLIFQSIVGKTHYYPFP